MKKTVAIAGLAVISVLGVHDAVSGENPEPSSPPVLLTDSVTTEKELLLFYEEADLYTATKRTTTLRKAPAIATIITADEIKNMGARNLEDVLKMVPGLGISINEWGTRMIEVRGIRTATSEKILVMIDGHSLNRNMYGSAVIYNIAGNLPIENIKQIEVVRGPGSALYGNSAFVATINIITRNAEEIYGLEVKGGGGSFDSYKGNIVGGTLIGDKLSLSGSFDYYRTDGPSLTVPEDYLSGNPSAFPFPTASFSLAPGAPRLDSRQSDAYLKIGYGDLSFRGHYQRRNEHQYIGLAHTLTDDSYGIFDNYWAELAYERALAKGLLVNFKGFYDYFEQQGQAKFFPNGFGGAFPNGMIAKPEVKNRTVGGELQFDWDPFKENHLIAGLSYEVLSQYDVRHLANFDPLTGIPLPAVQEVANWNRNVTRQIFAAYLQDEWQLLEPVSLTAGLRYDHYSDFGNTVNPRLGLVWSLLDNMDLKLLYGQAFRAPNFQELYNDNNSTVVGNEALKPEKIRTYEAGLGWRLNRYFAADINYFYSTIKNLIGWEPSTVPGQPAVNANIGKSETEGVETGIHGSYGTGLEWKATYIWQDPRDGDTGQRLPYVPSQRVTASVNYAPIKYINLHGDLLWTGKRLRTPGDSRSETPSYTTVDAAVTFKNFFKTLEIQATVRNIFDHRITDPDTSGMLNKVPGDFPREGISAFLTATYRF